TPVPPPLKAAVGVTLISRAWTAAREQNRSSLGLRPSSQWCVAHIRQDAVFEPWSGPTGGVNVADDR
ncbi:MAG: hypothetical protein AB1449_12935, partial [Chloroflexota bacterium]